MALYGAIGDLGSASTTGQWVAAVSHLAYAGFGFLAAWALFGRSRWTRLVLVAWAVMFTLTAGVAPVVWNSAGPAAGAAAGAVAASVAALVLWLADRALTR